MRLFSAPRGVGAPSPIVVHGTPQVMMEHPWTVVGLGDGGAHLGLLSEAPCPTFMLTHWVRATSITYYS